MTNIDFLSDEIKSTLFSKLCQLSEEGIFILDADFRYKEVNKSYVELLGFERNFLIGRLFGIYQVNYVAKTTLKLIKKALLRLQPNQMYQKDLFLMTSYGLEVPLNMSIWHTVVNGESYYIGLLRDISHIYSNQNTIKYLQNYDQVTNLPNRAFFIRKLTNLLVDNYHEVAVVRISIDRYRLMASTLGQETLNQLMVEFVSRIKKLELDDLICFANFSGEDFAMIFELNDANMVRNHLDQVMQLCEIPFSVNDSTVYIHISVGVSYYPKDAQLMEVLLNQAEKALEHVKRQGGDDIYWFNDKLNNQNVLDLQFENELRKAFDQSQFVAYYQPQVKLDTGEIVGFEALVRWHHPTRGILTPNQFIPAIITHKLSFELFFQMAEQVILQLDYWQLLGLKAYLSLNADAAEFNHRNFVTCLEDLITEHQIEPSNIHIEITESSLMLRHKAVKSHLDELKALGICLSLDDFGTGYASLSYLQEFPFDFIKVDKSFVNNITLQPTQRHIVTAIITLASALDMGIVAEGIEEEAQREVLTSIGCKYGQGYLFGKPMSADEATALLIAQQPV